MDNNLNAKLLVIVDENIKQLDTITERLIFCLAEVPLNPSSEIALNAIREFGSQWKRNNPTSKFHLTDFIGEEAIDTIIQMITNLRPTIKLFVFYNINRRHQKEAYLRQAINTARQSNYRNDQIQWAIENAEEYASVVKPLNLTDDTALTIIPDVFCNIFARILDIENDKNEKIKSIYNQIKPLIRLQFFRTNKENVTFSKRKMV